MNKFMKHICDFCGNPFFRYKSQVPGANKFCNSTCYGEFQKTAKKGIINKTAWVTTSCKQCGQGAQIRKCVYKKRGKKEFYCLKCCPKYYNRMEKT